MKFKGLFCLGVAMLSSFTFAEEAGRSLFNGKDLAGWEGNKDLWSVKDGAITGDVPASKEDPKKSVLTHNTFLVYKASKFSDFELTLKYRLVGGNSGIQYRSQELEAKDFGPVIGGYQADFEAGTKYSGILYEERGRGILALRGQKVTIKAGENNKPKIEETGKVGESDEIQAAIKQEDWNEYRVVAKGNHLQHFINGKLTVDVTDEDAANAAKEGYFALQVHQGPPMTVQFKDIVVKEVK